MSEQSIDRSGTHPGIATVRTRTSRISQAVTLVAVVAGNWIPGSPLEGFFSLTREQTIWTLCIYGFIAAGKKPSDAHPPAFATFEDGYRANVIVETILASARNGSVWTKVQY